MIAMITSRMMKMPPAMATLSRLRRIQAICPSERPWMALPRSPPSVASGVHLPRRR